MKDFTSQAHKVEQQLYPHKIVSLGDLHQIEGALFDLNGIDIEFEPSVIDSLNRQIGTSRNQLDLVKNAAGDVGQVHFRNFLSDATTFARNKDVVIIASPVTRRVVNVIVPRHEFIPVQEFFNFAQMLMDEAAYDFERIESLGSGKFDITVFMQSRNPTVRAFAPGEEHITDGAYLHWTGDRIELGNYYTRLVCSNGATETITRKETKLQSFTPAEVHRMISLAKSRELPKVGFERYEQKALEAMETKCSLSELQKVSASLSGILKGISHATVDSLLPTRKYEEYFTSRGVDIKRQGRLVKTDLPVWTVFNILTAFATHTDMIAPEDGRRGEILRQAMQILLAERDIKHYIEYE